MMSLWDALRMNMMISYQELVRTFHREYLFFSITLSRVSFDVQRRSRKIHSCFVISFLYPEASLVFNFTNNANFFQALWPVPFGNDSNLLIVFYVQIVPDDFVMQLHRF